MFIITKVRKSKLEEGKIIPLSLDYVFTRIFNDKSNIEIIESFIACILDIPLSEVQGKLEIVSRELPIESKQESDAKVDLLLHYGDEKINIELNNEGASSGVIDRNICYLCKIHAQELEYGMEDYNKIGTSIQICLNTKMKNKKKIIEEHCFMNKETLDVTSKKIKFLYVDIEKGAKNCYTSLNKLELLCRLIITNDKNEEEKLIEMLGDSIMTKKAREKLKSEINKYSKDNKAYEVYTKLSHQEIIRNGEINSAKKENSIEIAKKMLLKKISVEDIMAITNLTEKEIRSLIEQLNIDNKAYEVYTKLSHQEIIKNGELNSARKENSIEIAKKMLKEHLDIELIVKITGLTKEEIKALLNKA